MAACDFARNKKRYVIKIIAPEFNSGIICFEVDSVHYSLKAKFNELVVVGMSCQPN